MQIVTRQITMLKHVIESRKENLVPIVFEVTIQHIKVHKPMRYSYHICADTRHKIIDFSKYNEI
jgi:hypothetical protein